MSWIKVFYNGKVVNGPANSDLKKLIINCIDFAWIIDFRTVDNAYI
jgi:hypothetical protein